MAKRKRLAPAQLEVPAGLETKALKDGWAGVRRSTPPIADVASQAASQAAFEEVAGVLETARREGRLVQALPIAAIEVDHLVRDRLVLADEDMDALTQSLATRGQQTPIEVVALAEGRYGLISGWRRIEALRRLGQSDVLAMIRAPETASDAYVAMIEENEIRAGLSFYERARLAAEAVRIGVYRNAGAAVAALFANAPAPKRSKILKFVALHRVLDSALRFPAAIPEKLGLALASAIEADARMGNRLRDSLRKTPALDATEERARLERALQKATPPAPRTSVEPVEIAPGVMLEQKQGRMVLRGRGVDDALAEDLRAWFAVRSGNSDQEAEK
ncbi:MAG: ParB N-terminal domain-containing protein [Paracoccaceae bacterium]